MGDRFEKLGLIYRGIGFPTPGGAKITSKNYSKPPPKDGRSVIWLKYGRWGRFGEKKFDMIVKQN